MEVSTSPEKKGTCAQYYTCSHVLWQYGNSTVIDSVYCRLGIFHCLLLGLATEINVSNKISIIGCQPQISSATKIKTIYGTSLLSQKPSLVCQASLYMLLSVHTHLMVVL